MRKQAFYAAAMLLACLCAFTVARAQDRDSTRERSPGEGPADGRREPELLKSLGTLRPDTTRAEMFDEVVRRRESLSQSEKRLLAVPREDYELHAEFLRRTR